MLTGYFANIEQVATAADFIAACRARNSELYYLCDPVIGDDDELYVKQEVAEAIRDRLVPLAQGLSPNSFEAGWLSGTMVRDIESAKLAAGHWPDKDVIVTSVPEGNDRIATAVFGHDGERVVSRTRLAHVPHGTGDLLSGPCRRLCRQGREDRSGAPENCSDARPRGIAASQGSDSLDLARGLKP